MRRKRAATNRKRVTITLDTQIHIKGTKLAMERRPRLSFSRYLETLLVEDADKAA